MLQGFISYAHDDYAAFETIRLHLRAIERTCQIEFWADKRINAGDYWSKKIADAIEAAQVHILMVSPAFIGSEYIFEHELPAINNKTAKGDIVVPVVIDRCSWPAFVGVLQAAPMDRTGHLVPVFDWKPRRHGFNAAREQIEAAIRAKFGAAPTPAITWGKP